MEEERIERAAIELCTTEGQEEWLKDYGVLCFEDGARWRIDSAWHKPSDNGTELKRDVEVIAKTKRGYSFGRFDVAGYFHEYVAFVSTSGLEYALSDVLGYAYLSDLLPGTRKEEAMESLR